MTLANHQEEPGNIRLGTRICLDPIPYIFLSAGGALVAGWLAWHSSGGLTYWKPASGQEWGFLGAAVVLALFGCACPAYVLWSEAIGRADLSRKRGVFQFTAFVLAASSFVLIARISSNWDRAISISMTIWLAYLVERLLRHKRQAARPDSDAFQRRFEQRGRFLSIAVDELFDAVEDAHNPAPNTPSATKADDSIHSKGATEC